MPPGVYIEYEHALPVRVGSHYAEALTSSMPDGLDACMFTCTWSEANDLAYRIAMASSNGTGVITCERAYHGNTTFPHSYRWLYSQGGP